MPIGTTLGVTDAGLRAIGIGPVTVKTVVTVHARAKAKSVQQPPTSHTGTKQSLLIAMLQRGDGVAGSQHPRCDVGHPTFGADCWS